MSDLPDKLAGLELTLQLDCMRGPCLEGCQGCPLQLWNGDLGDDLGIFARAVCVPALMARCLPSALNPSHIAVVTTLERWHGANVRQMREERRGEERREKEVNKLTPRRPASSPQAKPFFCGG